MKCNQKNKQNLAPKQSLTKNRMKSQNKLFMLTPVLAYSKLTYIYMSTAFFDHGVPLNPLVNTLFVPRLLLKQHHRLYLPFIIHMYIYIPVT